MENIKVWPAFVIERFIMSKMMSITAGMDMLSTLDKHMPLDENIKATYVVLRMACSDMMHVLKDHKDPQLSPKHRMTKRVVDTFLKELEENDMVKKLEPEWFTRRACSFVQDLDSAMRGKTVSQYVKSSEAVITVTHEA